MRDHINISSITESRSVFVRRLLAIAVVANLFLMGLAGSLLWKSRTQYEERAEIATQNLSRVLAEQIADVVDKIDLIVLTVVDEVEKQLAGGGIDEPSLNAFIARHHARVPVLDGLRVVNAEGENAYGIAVVPGVRTSVADRTYFNHLRSGLRAGLVISEPVLGRVSNKWSIILARRINRPDGSFAGVVYGTITLKQLVATFTSIDVGKQGTIALRDDTLTQIARYPVPQDDDAVGRKNASPDLQQAVQVQKDAGTYRTSLSFDRVQRTHSYRKVSHHPFYVIVGLSAEEYLAAWRGEAIGVLSLVTLFVLGTLISSWMVYRGWVRRHNAVQALAEREETLRIERENLKAIFASAPVGMLLLDEEIRIVDANSTFAGMVSRHSGQIIHQRGGAGWGCVHSLEHEKGCGFGLACLECQLRKNIVKCLAAGTSVRGAEIQPTLLIDGQQRRPWLSVNADPVLLNGRRHTVVAVEDITARKAMEEELRAVARTDRLTGLPNRALLCERLQHAVLRSRQRKDYHFAILFLDIDRFKTINDSLGHAVGDLLLQEIGRRLQATVRARDLLSQASPEHTTTRLGGDEFVVLLEGIAGPRDATGVANRILNALAQPFQLGSHRVHSTASIGIVTSDMPAESADDVLRDADTAMYEAKLAGKGQHVVFDVAMRQRVQNRLKLENDLHRALEAGQLFLVYQPIVSLRTGRLKSFEALVRWRHPERGLISPAEFIPIAEDTGLILPIGEWVLREACGQFTRWQESMGDAAPISISVNLSRHQLTLPDLPQTIQRIMEETGMVPARLHLEVTESAVMKNAAVAVQLLRAIKAIGVRLDMDDFGTGYSSLACLHQFPIDVLKIDRSFIANIDHGRDFTALVHAVTQLAQNLNISVVAEGIETADQLLILQSLDCEFGQGYFFSKPLMADEVAEFRVRSCMLPGMAA